MKQVTAWEHFAAATELLAGSGSVKDRLFLAYRAELAGLDPDGLPQEVRGDYLRWHDSLHRVRALRGEHAVRATLSRLTGAEADRMAQSFVKLSLRLMRLPETRVPQNQNGAVVQLFSG